MWRVYIYRMFWLCSTKILSFIQDIISSTSGTRQSSSEIKCDDKINFYNCCISHLPRSVLLFAQPQYSTTVSQAWQYWGLRNIAETFKHFERERDGSTIQRRSNCWVPGKLSHKPLKQFQNTLQTAKICWLINKEWQSIETRQEAFLLYDQRGDGKIPVSQIGDVMRALGQVEFNITPHQIYHCLDRHQRHLSLIIVNILNCQNTVLRFQPHEILRTQRKAKWRSLL